MGLTQSAFATQLDIGNTTADIERGKTKISGQIIKDLLKLYQINPLWLYGESKQKYFNPLKNDTSPSIVTVDNLGSENILLVNAKAAAGYADNIGEEQYYQELPAFTFPLPEYRNATFRGFQITGDSMYPAFKEGEWVLTKALGNVSEVKSGNIYVIVERESIRLKKIKKIPGDTHFTLLSLNREYPPAEVQTHEVLELWEYHSKISYDLETSTSSEMLQKIYEDIQVLKSEAAKQF